MKAFVGLRPGHAAGDTLVQPLPHVKRVPAPSKRPRAIAFRGEPSDDGERQRVELRQREPQRSGQSRE